MQVYIYRLKGSIACLVLIIRVSLKYRCGEKKNTGVVKVIYFPSDC